MSHYSEQREADMDRRLALAKDARPEEMLKDRKSVV